MFNYFACSYSRSIDYHSRKFLTLSDFMLGMVALDSATTHGRKCGELRCRFIFRFYDRDEDGLLSFEEFKWVFHIVWPKLDVWFIKICPKIYYFDYYSLNCFSFVFLSFIGILFEIFVLQKTGPQRTKMLTKKPANKPSTCIKAAFIAHANLFSLLSILVVDYLERR